jgi:hypothetical protein
VKSKSGNSFFAFSDVKNKDGKFDGLSVMVGAINDISAVMVSGKGLYDYCDKSEFDKAYNEAEKMIKERQNMLYNIF